MIAGLEEISNEIIRIGERTVNEVPPKDRDIAMVFRNDALYLKLRKIPKAEIDTRVMKAAAILSLEDFLKRKPKALSGGQRQRVTMEPAIVRKPGKT